MHTKTLNWNTFDPERPIYFVGVGGCSMSGLALLLLERDFMIAGSDTGAETELRYLASRGVEVFHSHDASNMRASTQAVVSTVAAIPADTPELVQARRMGIPIIDRAEVLAVLMQQALTRVAVAGTSGKTTTTSLIGHTLLACGEDPTVSVGTRAAPFTEGGNYYNGGTSTFVAEACEYHEAFRYLQPTTAVVLNVLPDHGDYYPAGTTAMAEAFQRFVYRIVPGGTLIVSSDDPHARTLHTEAGVRRVGVGFSAAADYRIRDVRCEEGRWTFSIHSPLGSHVLSPALLGKHNITNVATAFAAACDLGLPAEQAITALNGFKGAPRRLQPIGTVDGVSIWDDLACTPHEASATMDALRTVVGPHRIVVVLRPNSFTRVRDHFGQYAEVFRPQERIFLTDIFPGRDRTDHGMHASKLAQNIASRGRNVEYVPDVNGRPAYDELRRLVRGQLRPGDALITIGPADITPVATAYRQAYGQSC
ncbi:UDP-N-acetylmuramate--L-alanine ligase [Kineosporia sp. NBRC 101677]|uniref:UDP-N-acetylmuramate--L-alanine ligase n=1 Tax=Kineosporia sp. NBRC 101677 TaxID=3032197 RepID=UPI0024A3DF58|nr:Mur ligase family protein [Kineosporia sp. NBRC 101677]GLY19960.1 UDP-N-acetylmuramate--L-alanine ligase [Kineosporia sp. NBRC 101677]